MTTEETKQINAIQEQVAKESGETSFSRLMEGCSRPYQIEEYWLEVCRRYKQAGSAPTPVDSGDESLIEGLEKTIDWLKDQFNFIDESSQTIRELRQAIARLSGGNNETGEAGITKEQARELLEDFFHKTRPIFSHTSAIRDYLATLPATSTKLPDDMKGEWKSPDQYYW